MKPIIIAIDGHSSCGKSSTAKVIAKNLGYIYIDTGAMYRAVTYYALGQRLISENNVVNEKALLNQLATIKIGFKEDQVTLNGEVVEDKIRSMKVSSSVSYISKIKEVREYLVAQQQKMGEDKAIVMDGRDIGSVVFPNAELKVFMTASSEERAKRRQLELQSKGQEVSIEEVLENLQQRDLIDSTRKESPLIQLPDSFVVDNTNLSFEQQVDVILAEAKSRMTL